MITVSIIEIPIQFVKPLLRSKVFWLSVGGLVLLLWLTKFKISKVVAILKLLWKIVVNILTIFLSLFLSPFIKMFQEIEET